MERETREVAPYCVRAAVSSVDDEARTVELIWSTGAPVDRMDWETGERYVERLSMDPASIRLERLNAGAPLLNSHNAYGLDDIIGVVEEGSAQVKGKKGTAKVRFSSRPEVESIWGDVRSGIIRNVSVGYMVHKYDETEGKKGGPKIRTAVDWEPYEVSLVPMPADTGARVRDGKPSQTNPCVIERRLEEETMEDKDKPETPPAADPAPVPAQRIALAAEDPVEVRSAERKRIAEIMDLCARHDYDGAPHIAKGDTIDQVRKAILEKKIAEEPDIRGAGVVPGADEADKRREGLVAWVVTRSGLAGLIREAQAKSKDHPVLSRVSLDPGEYRGLSLMEMARESLERQGVRTRGMGRMEIAKRALLGAQGTSDFTVGLENVMHKLLIAAFVITPDTWRRFCRIGSVTDFRAHNRYQLGALSALEELGAESEFKAKAIGDAQKESITAGTRGNILTLTREALINDDMGMFAGLAAQFGRAAALTIEKAVYTSLALNGGLGPALSDGKSIFHADHANIGTGSALSTTAVEADRVVMASQLDQNSNEVLDIRPEVLLVPIGLEAQAKVINASTWDPEADIAQIPNPVQGVFRDIIGTARLTGTRRYMFANPSLAPVIEVVFLEGVQEPYLEMREGFETDGIQWKARLDFGVGGVGSKGAVTNSGAA